METLAEPAATKPAPFLGFKKLNLNVMPMIELAPPTELLTELETNRLLTEVDHLATALEAGSDISAEVKRDVTTNLETALAEISMPGAVTKTAHRVETQWDPEKNRQLRTFRWLGRCAVGVAKSGYDFHFSPAAIKRVDTEVAEAAHAQETLQPGRVQFFLSPRMSSKDAPASIAKDEHLHDEDSIRASYMLVDKDGQETHRVMESLLLTDVPLEAWVAMLADENNLFEKSITVADAESALSVMQTFEELELSEDKVPEGAVTLVAAVIPYIKDEKSKLSVLLQLDEFRSNQALYQEQAARFAGEWYDFELELANSLRSKRATPEIENYIRTMKSAWADDIQNVINNHADVEGFVMSRQLAALLEKAKRNVIATKAGVKTGNDKIIEQLDKKTVEDIRRIDYPSVNNYDAVRGLQSELERSIVTQNVEMSGGCSGGACGLETVSKEESSSLIERLGGEKGDSVLKDKERKCKCGSKSIVYVFNDTKVIKHCEACGATEKKFSKAS